MDGKVVVVTGASGALGKVVAEAALAKVRDLVEVEQRERQAIDPLGVVGLDGDPDESDAVLPPPQQPARPLELPCWR